MEKKGRNEGNYPRDLFELDSSVQTFGFPSANSHKTLHIEKLQLNYYLLLHKNRRCLEFFIGKSRWTALRRPICCFLNNLFPHQLVGMVAAVFISLSLSLLLCS